MWRSVRSQLAGNSATGAPFKEISVRLIIVAQDGSRFVLNTKNSNVDCPRVVLRRGSSDRRSLPEWIDVAARQQLGLDTSFTALLEFQATSSSCELLVVVVLQSPDVAELPSRRFRVLLPHELRSAGISSDLLRHFDDARELYNAERQTTERHLQRHMAELDGQIQHARHEALRFLDQHVAEERGHKGWSPFFDSRAIGMLSTAQGLLSNVHAGERGVIVEAAANTIESMQNPDGGWQVRQALVGHESAVSITESTCYCIWALLEADRTLEHPSVVRGLDWLERTQQHPSGGWAPIPQGEAHVSTTAIAVRILARCDRPGAMEGGVAWLRASQHRDGGWGLTTSRASSPAYTAHAALALLAAGVVPDDPAVARACKYMCDSFRHANDEPWEPAIDSTVVDDETPSRLEFRHFATPWVLAALSLAGRDLSDPTILLGVDRLLARQEPTGAWRCGLMPGGTFALWAIHDALFALNTIEKANTPSLAPVVRDKHRERERQLLHRALASVIDLRPSTPARRWIHTAWLAILTGVVASLVAARSGAFAGSLSVAGVLKVLTAGATTLIVAFLPPILAEEYKALRRRSQARRTARQDSSF